MSISRMSRADAQRPSCSARMRHEGLRLTWPSYRQAVTGEHALNKDAGVHSFVPLLVRLTDPPPPSAPRSPDRAPAWATDETGAGGKEEVPMETTEAEVVSIESSEVMETTEAEVVSIESSEVMETTEAEVVSIKSSEVMHATPVGSAAHPHGVASAHPHAVAAHPHAVAPEAATECHRAGRHGRRANS
jgi:hypothetical protein